MAAKKAQRTKKPGTGTNGRRAAATGGMRKALAMEDQAAVLIEANIIGDDEAAEKYGINVRTLRRYRAELREGGELSELVRYRLQELSEADDWAAKATETIRDALAFIQRVCRETEYLGPDMLEAVTGALAVLVDAKIATQLIEASLNAQRPTNDGTQAAADPKAAAGAAHNPWIHPAATA